MNEAPQVWQTRGMVGLLGIGRSYRSLPCRGRLQPRSGVPFPFYCIHKPQTLIGSPHMHSAAYAYVARVAAERKLVDKPLICAEFGAFNVNGSARELFVNARCWTGVDVREGPGVDVVDDAARWHPDARFDLILCTETLEHAPQPQAIIANAARLLAPGGVLILTAATDGRDPHSVDGAALGHKEHYGNVHESDLTDWLAAAFGTHYRVEVNERDKDIYATAWKAAKA